MYTDWEYARGRLQDSIVVFKQRPVYIKSVDPNLECSYSYLDTGRGSKTDINNLNLEPIRLGYSNQFGFWTYLMRVPHRAWVQGLRARNVRTIEGGVMGLDNEGIVKTYNNEYPTLEQAKDICGVDKIAFSRHWALQGNSIIFKDRPVGNFEGNNYELFDNKQHLQEYFQEVI